MKIQYLLICLFTLFLLVLIVSGNSVCTNRKASTMADTIPIIADSSRITTPLPSLPVGEEFINTGQTTPNELVSYAKSLIGIPYKYGSSDPNTGFDCSGFITYVFNHFNITVPRSSVAYTDVDRPIDISDVKPGDLILFTGTDSTIREVGHMGIIVTGSEKEISFIHSTSGKAYGVTITPLNSYYQGRFVKAIRIFRQNDED